MRSNQALNPNMQVLEHSASKLVLLDGARGYGYGTIPSSKNLILQPLIAFIVCSSSIFLATGSFVWQGFLAGIAIAAFPFAGILLVRIYGNGRYSTYTFDKSSGILTASTPAIFPYRPPKIVQHQLNQIVAVEPVTKDNDEPPPTHWRSIELRMKAKKIVLYPGHDEQIQERMTNLIRRFLD